MLFGGGGEGFGFGEKCDKISCYKRCANHNLRGDSKIPPEKVTLFPPPPKLAVQSFAASQQGTPTEPKRSSSWMINICCNMQSIWMQIPRNWCFVLCFFSKQRMILLCLETVVYPYPNSKKAYSWPTFSMNLDCASYRNVPHCTGVEGCKAAKCPCEQKLDPKQVIFQSFHLKTGCVVSSLIFKLPRKPHTLQESRYLKVEKV